MALFKSTIQPLSISCNLKDKKSKEKNPQYFLIPSWPAPFDDHKLLILRGATMGDNFSGTSSSVVALAYNDNQSFTHLGHFLSLEQ